LGCKILNIHVASPATRSVVGDHSDSTFVVFAGGSGGCEWKAQIFEKLSEVFSYFSGIATGDDLRFGGGEGGCALDASASKDFCTAEHDHDSGDGAWVAKDE
jgi:hypothetical protein